MGFATPLPDPPAASIVRTITHETLRSVRDLALHVARVCGVAEERAEDLGLALHELGVNAVVHGTAAPCGCGAPPRRWSARSVTAGRGGPTDRSARPGTEEPDGRGLWMVNQLCDLVQLRSSESGTTVRVHTWL